MKKHSQLLELPAVLEKLSDEACMPQTKQNCLLLQPQFNEKDVIASLNETEDAYILIAKYSAPSFGNSSDISHILTQSKLGALLSISDLLEVSKLLHIVNSVKKWHDNCSLTNESSIDYIFSSLMPNKFLEDKINYAIKDDQISDNASTQLSDIRRKIANNNSKIRDILDKIIKGPTSRYLQDAIITQRDGRFVVPVKAEYKGEFKGIVHDTSSTGSTYFIEPISVVETNNEIRILRIKEQEEIVRILSELSAAVSDFSDSIKFSYDNLVKLDLVFAKAKLGYKMGAIIPKINDRGYLYLKNARHPLISTKTVVPITVSLGGEYDTLVITGPNTGGKTVTLKTIGLLTMMTMCGMMIPVDDTSEISIFNRIFADIGDEQSIQQSLSTFSSHMVNIISILDDCDENSLVLFDELCAGTDPVEGAALAKAILITLANKSAKTVATTHYPELKSYALDTDRVENASCEFDVTTLKPTYKLVIGVPGRSNAFAISKRLGLDNQVISIAENQVSEDDLRFERIVASLEKARQEAEQERKIAVNLRSEAAALKKKSEILEREFKIKQEKIMEQTREKAISIIEEARYKSSLILNELEEAKKMFNTENASSLLEKARIGYKKAMRDLEESADPIGQNQSNGEKLIMAPKKGEIVILNDFNKDATVIDVNESKNKVQVMSGSMKMWVSYDELRIKKNKKSTQISKTRNVTGLVTKQNRSVSGEIDLRGMASDEAILELDKYIDNSVLTGITNITVIHGKGTGVLRKAVQAHLKSHKNVKTFRIGIYGEGENGVTIAELG
ncbi:MAG: endonuclease MutS2 [Clostridia bacterium]|nr:endonuclease MutS2 [Clostridia bacterium]